MPNAQSTNIEQFREYLHLLARLHTSSWLAHKLDISGVVQQTIWEAAQVPPPTDSQEALLAWLRRMLSNNLRDEVRRLLAARRDVRREMSLESAIENSASRVEAWLTSQQSSPSQRAVRAEDLNQLAIVLSQLPDDQRQAIEMHHLQGLPLQAVADHLGRSKEAVASLLYRAMKRLRTHLDAAT